MEFLESEMPEFISLLLWPPYLPDLNPVDYSVWSILQEKVYKTCITDLNNLKYHIRIRNKWPSCIMPSLLQLCVSSVAIFQLVSSTTFNSELCFCNKCGLWSLHSPVESNSWYSHLIFLQLSVMTLCILMHDNCFNWQGSADICCVNLVSFYLDGIPCKNYNYVFMFVKFMPETLLIFFQTVYTTIL